ncbi:MAG: hypothetical protein WCH83_18465 [Alphaproteobacteria bacterium]
MSADQTMGSVRRKVVTDTGTFDAELRTLAYAMVNSFVTQHAIMSSAVGMRPAKLLVYLVIVAATTQKQMRVPHPTAEFRAGAKIPVDKFGHISRRAIGTATGVPNENVRRIVNELIAEELVIVGPSGGVRNTGGNFQNPAVMAALKQMFAEQIRLQQIFLDTGAIAVSA